VNGPPGSALGVNLGSDAVEQFTVLSSKLPSAIRALFGRHYWRFDTIGNEGFPWQRI